MDLYKHPTGRRLRPNASPETGSCNLFLEVPKRLFFFPQRPKPTQPLKSPTPSVHRCFLIPEIFCLILDFIQKLDASLEEDGCCKKDRTLGKRTLTSVARTCRAFSASALDVLWMRLDSLDPLIKVLPSRIWAKKHPYVVVRMLLRDRHWSTFQKYAVRVQCLRGPCRSIPPSVQRNVITALAQFSVASLSLVPNLTKLVWSESDSLSIIDSTVPLIKYFAGPRVTTVSLFLVSWPVYITAQAALINLPDICPNVTSFTVIPYATLNNRSRAIGDIVNRWSHLQLLRTCALPQTVMDELASKETLNTLCIKLDNCVTDVHVKQLPTTVHTFSLEGSNAMDCIRYLQMLQGDPTHLRLRVGSDVTLPWDMNALFEMLPVRFDTIRLQNLTISLRSSFRPTFPRYSSFHLTESLLGRLYAFSSLVALDVNSFCASQLDDAAYEQMASAWPELKSLKVGAVDVSRAKPIASVGAVMAVLRSCPCLGTLHIVFDGSIPPPSPKIMLAADKGTQRGRLVGVRVNGVEEGMEVPACSYGILNQYLTQIYVGHSPIGKDVDGLKNLASCLRSVMPRLERIQWGKEPPSAADVANSEGWQFVQRMLIERDQTRP